MKHLRTLSIALLTLGLGLVVATSSVTPVRADEGASLKQRLLEALRKGTEKAAEGRKALGDGEGRTAAELLRAPLHRIEHPQITESSGVVHTGGAYWTHNDSNGGAVLFRSVDPSFPEDRTEVLTVPFARNVDWEDIAVLDGDVLVCDVGDNDRRREYLTVHRVRYRPQQGERLSGLDFVAKYPLRYPDGAHDTEGAFVADGKLHLVVKDRGEGRTSVYRFDELVAQEDLPRGQDNVPKKLVDLRLPPGAQVTAADVHAGKRRLAVLTYGRIHVFDLANLDGAPVRSDPIFGLQSEGLCFRGDDLVVTNEQRGVFVCPDYLDRPQTSARPSSERPTETAPRRPPRDR